MEILDLEEPCFLDLTDEITNVYAEYIAPHFEVEEHVILYVPSQTGVDIDERLKIAYKSKSGPKIQRLMEGDVSGYTNLSSADMALATHLAFWLDNDPMLIEEAFNRTPLARRDKWKKRLDYRTCTIHEAVERTTKVYTPWQPPEQIEPEPQKAKSDTPIITVIPSMKEADKAIAILSSSRMSTLTAPPLEFLLYPFILKNATTAFTGEPAHSKTTALLHFLHQIANEHPEVLVVYCDADNPAAIARERSDRLRGELKDLIHYWSRSTTDADGELFPPYGMLETKNWIDFIKRVRETSNRRVLVAFDTLNSFMNGDNENDNAALRRNLTEAAPGAARRIRSDSCKLTELAR